MKRDSLLILLDEFDVINNKAGLGSLIKSLTAPNLKFGVCGVGHDLMDLIEDHASVERLLEQGAIHVRPMISLETNEIIERAEQLFNEELSFTPFVKKEISRISEGYPYFTQLLGKECVAKANQTNTGLVEEKVFNMVMDDVRLGRSFPTLERAYQRAIGNSTDRQLLLH